MGRDHRDFILEDKFIEWRLLKTEILNNYWEDFSIENPELSNDIYIAIQEFESVKFTESKLSDTEKKEMFNSVIKIVKRKEKIKTILRATSTIAATIILGVLISLYSNLNNKDTEGYEKNILGQTMPEEEVYIISNDNKTSLSDNSLLELTADNKAVITNNIGGTKEVHLTSTSLNRIVVPYGRRSTITLADGSKVWLNSGTQLDFPSKFTGKTREISVNGEIYIEVKENNDKPFIVNTDKMSIQVYGTSFNVTSFKDEESQSIVLVDGKVVVKTLENKHEITLKPHEMISLSKNNVIKEEVDISKYISWTKDILVFDETPISEILKKIGRYYNVQFDNLPEVVLNEQTCSGKLFLSNNLDSVMMSISSLSSTKYERNNNIINISKVK